MVAAPTVEVREERVLGGVARASDTTHGIDMVLWGIFISQFFGRQAHMDSGVSYPKSLFTPSSPAKMVLSQSPGPKRLFDLSQGESGPEDRFQ